MYFNVSECKYYFKLHLSLTIWGRIFGIWNVLKLKWSWQISFWATSSKFCKQVQHLKVLFPGTVKVRFSTIGCTETKCWWTIQTAFFFLSKAKVLAKLSAFSISSTFIRQVFSAWASIFEIVSVTENLLSQTGRVISDVSVPCFTMGQRNGF